MFILCFYEPQFYCWEKSYFDIGKMFSRVHDYVREEINNQMYYIMSIWHFILAIRFLARKVNYYFNYFSLGFKLIDIKLQIPNTHTFLLIQSVDEGKRPHTLVG